MLRGVLLLLLMVLVGCVGRTPDAPQPMTMPLNDPLRGSAAESLWQQAVAAREQNRLALAGRYLERALSMEPESSWLYRELAELRLREGDPQSAEVMVQRALRLAPPRAVYQSSLWHLLATARMRQGDEAGAERARLEAQMWMRRQ